MLYLNNLDYVLKKNTLVVCQRDQHIMHINGILFILFYSIMKAASQ